MKKQLFLPIALSGMLGASLQAAIVVETVSGTGHLTSASNASPFSVNDVEDSFLIIAIMGDNQPSSISVNSSAMANDFTYSDGFSNISFWSYDLDGEDKSGGTVALTETGDGFPNAYKIFQVSGAESLTTVTGGGFTSSDNSLSATLDTDPAAGAFLLGAGTLNRNANVPSLDTVSENAVDYGSLVGVFGWTDTIAASVDETTAYTMSWDSGSAAGTLGLIAYQAVPEPSTYALLAGFLALGAVMVRRRSRN